MKTMIEPSASTATKTRVLIVDDNRRFAEGARAILQRAGQYTVCVETNALRALHDVPIVFVTALITPEEASDGGASMDIASRRSRTLPPSFCA